MNQLMIQIAVILLGLTAAGGIIMALMRFAGGDRPPSWLAMAHGLLAGSGLTLLLFAALTSQVAMSTWGGIGLLIAAALIGAYLNLVFHAKLLALPKGTIVIHALLAVTGFALILWTVLA